MNDIDLITANGDNNYKLPASRLPGLYVSKIVGYQIGEVREKTDDLKFLQRFRKKKL